MSGASEAREGEGAASAPERRIIVAAGVVITNGNGDVLLLQRRKQPAAGFYAVPAGKLEWGESLWHCARREAHEEVDVLLDATDLGRFRYYIDTETYPDEGVHVAVHYFATNMPPSAYQPRLREPEKHAALIWASARTIATLVDTQMIIPAVARAICHHHGHATSWHAVCIHHAP